MLVLMGVDGCEYMRWVLMLVLMGVDGCEYMRWMLRLQIFDSCGHSWQEDFLKNQYSKKKSKTKKRTDETDIASVHIVVARIIIQLGG